MFFEKYKKVEMIKNKIKFKKEKLRKLKYENTKNKENNEKII